MINTCMYQAIYICVHASFDLCVALNMLITVAPTRVRACMHARERSRVQKGAPAATMGLEADGCVAASESSNVSCDCSPWGVASLVLMKAFSAARVPVFRPSTASRTCYG